MITLPDLQSALLELQHELNGTEIHLIIGGGYGLYRRMERARKSGVRTLLREWPEPRSTNDLDLFLRPELLIDSEKLKPLAAAFAKLGYEVVSGAEKYQFMKPGPGGSPAGSIKIDILTGTQRAFEGTTVKADGRRARPVPSVGIHAHIVDAALTLNEKISRESIGGPGRSVDPSLTDIFLLHPFTFLMMKLFAFRDRLDDAGKEFGRYHALDVYSILATTTEEEWREALDIRDQHAEEPAVLEAGRIVEVYFSFLNGQGLIRLRESPYYRPEFQLDEFMSAIQELFPTRH